MKKNQTNASESSRRTLLELVSAQAKVKELIEKYKRELDSEGTTRSSEQGKAQVQKLQEDQIHQVDNIQAVLEKQQKTDSNVPKEHHKNVKISKLSLPIKNDKPTSVSPRIQEMTNIFSNETQSNDSPSPKASSPTNDPSTTTTEGSSSSTFTRTSSVSHLVNMFSANDSAATGPSVSKKSSEGSSKTNSKFSRANRSTNLKGATSTSSCLTSPTSAAKGRSVTKQTSTNFHNTYGSASKPTSSSAFDSIARSAVSPRNVNPSANEVKKTAPAHTILKDNLFSAEDETNFEKESKHMVDGKVLSLIDRKERLKRTPSSPVPFRKKDGGKGPASGVEEPNMEMEQLKVMFDVYDRDKTGDLSVDEFSLLLSDFSSEKMTKQKIADIFSQFTAGKTGMAFADLLSWWNASSQKELKSEEKS